MATNIHGTKARTLNKATKKGVKQVVKKKPEPVELPKPTKAKSGSSAQTKAAKPSKGQKTAKGSKEIAQDAIDYTGAKSIPPTQPSYTWHIGSRATAFKCGDLDKGNLDQHRLSEFFSSMPLTCASCHHERQPDELVLLVNLNFACFDRKTCKETLRLDSLVHTAKRKGVVLSTSDKKQPKVKPSNKRRSIKRSKSREKK